jgi:hypothetical protein
VIIGLGHQAQVGKDTVASFMNRFRRLAFADPLRKMAYDIDPIIGYMPGGGFIHLADHVDKHGWESAKKDRNVRDFLVRLGGAARDTVGQDVWLDLLMAKVNPKQNTVITDVRYRNEFDRIREAGGVLVDVVRPGYQHPAHQHETMLDGAPWDFVIVNDGTLTDLARKAQNLVSDLSSVLH